MASDKQALRWGVERRLEFIEFRLFWEGGVNRSDIVEEFGVSVPQASKDISLYQEQAPHNLRYDKSLKRYFAGRTFSPIFIRLDADAYLAQLTPNDGLGSDTSHSLALSAIRLPLPHRNIKPEVLRAVLGSMRKGEPIEVYYQSMNASETEPLWRGIWPHAFGHDGLRWHVRAYCYIDKKFRDFILSRSLDTRASELASADHPDDVLWNTEFGVCLEPNPLLGKAQRAIIAEDFGMRDGRVVVPVRQAMLYYFSKRLRLDVADRFDDPKEAPVVIKNRAEFDRALTDAMQ